MVRLSRALYFQKGSSNEHWKQCGLSEVGRPHAEGGMPAPPLSKHTIGDELKKLRCPAEQCMLSAEEIAQALGPRAHVERGRAQGPAGAVGEVVRAAAVDSAFRSYVGRIDFDEGPVPIAVSILALIFGTPESAERTFDHVARAAHLRTVIDESEVAVETIAGAAGMVSYWGFLHRAEAIVVLTLDTLSPQDVSVADLRSLVTAAAPRLAEALP
jgi:hypothetical protein